MTRFMSKIVQHFARSSGTRRCVITTTLLSVLVLVPAALSQAPATHFEVLHTFHGSDGYLVGSGVILDTAGNVYGTAAQGGDLNCPGYSGVGCGTVFALSATGSEKEKVLRKFNQQDGAMPLLGASLSRDSQGNLYGETSFDSDNSCACGLVFKIDPTGHETVLYSFTGTNGDGENGPKTLGSSPGVIIDGKGNLYGTTIYGGNPYDCGPQGYGCGTVFELIPSGGKWTEKVLYRFKGAKSGDGFGPWGNLIEDAAGNLYGTTYDGGLYCPNNQANGCGTVFELTRSGGKWTEKVLYSFTGLNGDGATPGTTLVMDKEGNLYGTTSTGGAGASGGGIVFKVTKTGKTWNETILYSFSGPDGLSPYGPVEFDAAGNLYGTTTAGGSLGYGTVFKLTPKGETWTETVLHTFTGGKDGNLPYQGVTIDSTGSLYGTAAYGGDLTCAPGGGSGCGVVFKITQ